MQNEGNAMQDVSSQAVKKRVSGTLQAWLSLTQRRQLRRVRLWDPSFVQADVKAQREPTRV